MLKRKPVRTLLMFALALALCFGSFGAAFAANGTEGDPAKATIAKVLKVPQGTSLPADGFTFTFDFTAVSVDGVAATTDNMPAVASKTVKIAASDSGTDDSGVTTYKKESTDIFDGVAFPHSGIYVYDVAEQQSGAFTATSGWTENMTYSQAKYTVTAVVKQGTTNKFIESIFVAIDVVDNPTQTVGTKVEPTPGDSKMTFTNAYVKTKTGNDPRTDSTFSIGTTTAGDYADMTLYFPLEVTVTKSELEAGASPKYRAYVVDTSDNTVVSDDDGIGLQKTASDTYGDYYDLPSGTVTSLNLKHGQKLAFVGVPVGTAWIANDVLGNDAPYVNYTASGTANGVTLTSSVNAGESLSTGNQLVTEAAGGAAFTNTYNMTTPTGIILNNLPAIGLIVLALAALAVFIVARSRRRSRDRAYD
jgi:hypothetical protein